MAIVLWTLLLLLQGTFGFVHVARSNHKLPLPRFMALGDFQVELTKPLGLVLEERDNNNSGVQVQEVDGAAASTRIVPGDVLLQVNDVDVSQFDFDSVMDLLISSEGLVKLTLGDGLGQMDMPKNVVSFLKSTEDMFFVDAVVRQAVRETRRLGSGKLGALLQVEVIVGAGVPSPTVAKVRFFAIFSTDGVSTYSCNISATGVRHDDESIEIVALSCAKDEGLGQTYELIREET